MAHIVYEDERVTEYNDGTEEVRFSEEEWKVMERNPRYFGLVLPCGHANQHYDPAEGCFACFAIAETIGDATEAEAQAIYDSYPRAPKDKDF